MLKHTILLAAVAGLVLALAPVAQALTIYFDDFSGAGNVNLNGTTPDITPTGTETWTADASFKANGYNGEWDAGTKYATLPFTPSSGLVYTLSVSVLDADPYNSENYNTDPIWIKFGSGPGITIYDTSAGPVFSTGGPSADVLEVSVAKAAISAAIVLDTRPAAWEVKYFINNASVRGPETYITNPTITTVEIGKFWMAGLWDNLTLKATTGIVYWDIDGTTAGSGPDDTPDGTWDAANAYWNDSPDGTGTAAFWAAGDTAVFAAGGDATGTYTVTVDGTQDIGGLTFEEGTVTLSVGTLGKLRLVSNAEMDVASALTATVATVISEDATARNLSKVGDGTLELSGANTYTGDRKSVV